MNEFVFEQTPWELASEGLKPGDTMPAARFLALLEGEDEETVLDAMEELTRRHIRLDIGTLPKMPSGGELTARLALEEKLARRKNFPACLAELEQTDPLRLYMEELAATPAAGDAQSLADRYAGGETDAAGMLLNVSMPWVLETARKLAGSGVLLLDLIQEGSLELWQCIRGWQGGDDFEGTAQWRVAQAMVKTVVMQARANGVGQRMRELMERYGAADRRLLTELGRNPELEEIALDMGISPEDAAAVRQMMRAAQTMEQAKRASRKEEPEEAQAVEDTAYFRMRERVGELLSALDDADARILTLRFGLEGGLPLSPEETGRKLGLTAEEVTRREASALARLRRKE